MITIAVDVVEPPAYDDDDDDQLHLISAFATSGDRPRPPIYSLTRSRSEYTFPSPTDYVYSSKRLALNLGPRINHTPVPSYGRNGTIAGTVSVGSLYKVKHLSVTISGTATTTLTDPSLGNALLSESRTFLCHTIPLYNRHNHPAHQPSSPHFSFSYTLPTSTKLPPSCSSRTPSMTFSIRYRVTVDLARAGFRRHESLCASFLYLPRSVPRPPSYVTNGDWETFIGIAVGCSGGAAERAKVQLHLPCPRSYTSGTAIPFQITLSSPTLTRFSLRKLKICLVKIVTVRTAKLISSSALKDNPLQLLLQSGHIYGCEKDDEEDRWKITGSLDAVKQGSESAWSVQGGFIDVRFAIRMILPLSSSVNPSSIAGQIECEVPVELVTDTPDAFPEDDKDGWERPAVGLMFSAGMAWR